MVSSYPYISSYTFRNECDHGMMLFNDTAHVKSLGNHINPDQVKDGDMVYIVTELLPQFLKRIAPLIKSKYHLVCGRSDILIDNSYCGFMDDNIVSWSSPNMVADCDDRFNPIPLGLQNLNWGYDNNPQSDIKLIESIAKTNLSIENDVLMSFQIHTNSGERQQCFRYFNEKPFTKHRSYNNDDRKNREFVSDYFRDIKKSKFVVCPWGNGVDCHRNYEVWYLGSIPIIKRHKALEFLYDLPAWWVDDWNEVDENNINEKYEEIINKEWNTEKLYFDYWIKKIKNYDRITQ